MARREQLNEYINANRDSRFEWGTYDCCLFVARWLHKQGMPDYTKDFVGHYNSKLGAAKRIKELGYTGVRDMAVKHLKPGTKPRAGDIAYWKEANALGIVAGARVSYFADNVSGGVMAIENKRLEFWEVA